ncbi:60S ribosomal protein L35, L29 [Savitreella phatthalungensis]
MAGNKVAAHTLKKSNKAELLQQLEDLRKELASLRVQKVAGGASSKVTKIHDVRKNIARVLTVIQLSSRDAVRQEYKNKKHLPLDLRVRQTRAIRRRLSKNQANKVTERVHKRLSNFPQRKYAVRA